MPNARLFLTPAHLDRILCTRRHAIARAAVQGEGKAMDPITLAGAAVAVLSPFMPALTKAGQDATGLVAKAIAEKGGQAAFDLAKKVWGKVTARFGGDAEVSGLSNLVAASPEDETYQTLLAKALAKRLADAPDLAKQLEDDLGGQAGV